MSDCSIQQLHYVKTYQISWAAPGLIIQWETSRFGNVRLCHGLDGTVYKMNPTAVSSKQQQLTTGCAFVCRSYRISNFILPYREETSGSKTLSASLSFLTQLRFLTLFSYMQLSLLSLDITTPYLTMTYYYMVPWKTMSTLRLPPPPSYYFLTRLDFLVQHEIYLSHFLMIHDQFRQSKKPPARFLFIEFLQPFQ